MNKKISLVLTVLMVLSIVFGALIRPVQVQAKEELGPKEPYSFHDSDLSIYRAAEYRVERGQKWVWRYIFYIRNATSNKEITIKYDYSRTAVLSPGQTIEVGESDQYIDLEVTNKTQIYTPTPPPAPNPGGSSGDVSKLTQQILDLTNQIVELNKQITQLKNDLASKTT